jgi:hypothetical protein
LEPITFGLQLHEPDAAQLPRPLQVVEFRQYVHSGH